MISAFSNDVFHFGCCYYPGTGLEIWPLFGFQVSIQFIYFFWSRLRKQESAQLKSTDGHYYFWSGQ